MRTTAIINQKGGVGKTTTATNLAGGLNRRGYSVLLIDLDPQANLSYTFNALRKDHTVKDILEGNDIAIMTVTDRNGAYMPKADVTSLHIIPANQNLASAKVRGGYMLRDTLQSLNHYDFCIIDTPPSIGILTANALAAADDIIITTEADIFSLQGMGLLYQNLQGIKNQNINPDLKVDGILITRYDSRANATRKLKAEIEGTAKLFKSRIYKTPIRKCIALSEAILAQKSIFEYKPNCNGAKDYNNLIDEYLGE